jgi:type VI secretion system protein ImpG
MPKGDDMRRRLIRLLVLSQLDTTSLRALRDTVLLHTYYSPAAPQLSQAVRIVVDSLLEARSTNVSHMHRRVPVRGKRTVIDVDEFAFGCTGEIYLFGCLLNELVALQTPINNFSEFVLRGTKTQTVFQWPRRVGRHMLDD